MIDFCKRGLYINKLTLHLSARNNFSETVQVKVERLYMQKKPLFAHEKSWKYCVILNGEKEGHNRCDLKESIVSRAFGSTHISFQIPLIPII